MTAVPTRDWKSLPDDPARIQFNAGVLLQAMGPSTIAVVRRWVKEGELNGITHMGTGASYRGILAALETPGATPKPIPRQPSWSDALERVNDMRPQGKDA